MANAKDRKNEAAPSDTEGTEERYRGINKTFNEGLPKPTLKYREGRNEKEVIGKKPQPLETLSNELEDRRNSRFALGVAWLGIHGLVTRHGGQISTTEINFTAGQIKSHLRNKQRED